MPAEAGEKRGAPKGKPKSKKQGFYSKVMDEAKRLDFELAAGVEGVDDEIALLRVEIKSLLANDPENIKQLMEATNTLVRLVQTKYKITKEQRQGLKEAIENVIKEIAVPLGIGIGQIVTK
ncbi:MAG TPA: hypothetical protein G4N91_01160 [Dehalococcoidia bacterium]|nr:hypothetical protein [Dehalococcoidia bacterium]